MVDNSEWLRVKTDNVEILGLASYDLPPQITARRATLSDMAGSVTSAPDFYSPSSASRRPKQKYQLPKTPDDKHLLIFTQPSGARLWLEVPKSDCLATFAPEDKVEPRSWEAKQGSCQAKIKKDSVAYQHFYKEVDTAGYGELLTEFGKKQLSKYDVDGQFLLTIDRKLLPNSEKVTGLPVGIVTVVAQDLRAQKIQIDMAGELSWWHTRNFEDFSANA